MEGILYSFVSAGSEIEQHFFTVYTFPLTEMVTLTARRQQQTFCNV